MKKIYLLLLLFTGFISNTVNAQTDSLGVSTIMLSNFQVPPCGGDITYEQNFTIQGFNLTPSTGNIIIAAPLGFKIRTGNTLNSDTISIPYSNGALSDTTIYVNYYADGVHQSGNITFYGGGITNAPTVFVGGAPGATQYMLVTTTANDSFGQVFLNTPSVSFQYSITGLFFGETHVSSTNHDFQLSLDNTTWDTTVTFSDTGAVNNMPLYLRFFPSIANVMESTIIAFVGGTGGCGDQSFMAYGLGYAEGIPEVYNNNDIKIYPSPATNELNIKMSKAEYKSFTITNSIGKIVSRQQVTGLLTTADIKSLPAGMYYLTLQGDKDVSVAKFLKL